MCGIAGILNIDGRLPAAQLAVVAGRMADAMRHRGPDDGGLWVAEDGRCVLAHRRLSIIDTSSAGHQPMVTADGRHVLAFNGELYNFRELRTVAEECGERFASQSDTEVFLNGLARQGTHFLAGVDAMFAIAWYDVVTGELVLAVDAFGEKPLYYTEQNGLFAFASELSALTALPGFDPTITAGTLSAYLAFQKVPPPATIYAQCRQLPPGHFLRVGRDGIRLTRRYHHFVCAGETTAEVTLDDKADELEALLIESLRRRLIADVPLGAFLSGGIDSSTAVALVARRLNRSLKTFSIGFAGVPESEHLAARAMAEHLGTDHYDEMIDPGQFGELAALAADMDEPNSDSSCVPTFAISALARRQVTVALTGDGGDEMFGGYARYYHCIAAAEAHAADIAAKRWHVGRDYFSRHRFMVFDDVLLAGVFGVVPAATADLLFEWRQRLDLDPRPVIDRLREADLAVYLPVVLAKVDRMSMRHSLECRTPYLSVDIARFAAGLAPDMMYGDRSTKRVLRRIAERYLPGELLNQPKKGFGVDPRNQAAQRSVLARLATLLAQPDARLKAWFKPARLDDLLERVFPNCGFYNAWAFLVLELWLRKHPHRAFSEAI
jgi:asparagine synthase (glutamine-hydrolysing)